MTEKQFVYDCKKMKCYRKIGNEPYEEVSLEFVLNDIFSKLDAENIRLQKENERLKKALLFFIDVANTECSSNWLEDMEKDCKRFFNCTYEEAKEKYGNYDGS